MPKKINTAALLFAFLVMVLFSTTVAFAGNPPDQANSSFTATEVPADGTTQSTIIVILKDSLGDPLEGDTIQIANSTDSTIVFASDSATLDATGSATFTATSTTAGTDPIDVTDTSTSTTLSALGNVIFDPATSPSEAPSDTPEPTSIPSATPTSSPYTGVSTPTTGSSALLYLGFTAILLLLGGSCAAYKFK
jgi:Bacterial Ig-like domain (group 1)